MWDYDLTSAHDFLGQKLFYEHDLLRYHLPPTYQDRQTLITHYSPNLSVLLVLVLIMFDVVVLS